MSPLLSANEDVKVDERVINIVRNSYAEDKNNPDELTRPKSASFLSRSGSFTTKGKDKDKAAMKKQEYDDRDKEKDSQLLKNVSLQCPSINLLCSFGNWWI